VYSIGDSHSTKVSPSSEHSSVASSSLAEKLKVAIVSYVGSAGLPWSVVSGGTMSRMTLHV
jgi:hypothetical protein